MGNNKMVQLNIWCFFNVCFCVRGVLASGRVRAAAAQRPVAAAAHVYNNLIHRGRRCSLMQEGLQLTQMGQNVSNTRGC